MFYFIGSTIFIYKLEHMKQKKFNYFYRITNNINGNYYYGIHSTDNINDGYMGSGKRLLKAYKLFGGENFSKEILKYFDNREELEKYEASVVTEELVKDENCYNAILGGGKIPTLGMVPVYGNDNCYTLITTEEYNANKEKYQTPTTGYIVVRKPCENTFYKIPMEEYYGHENEYIKPSTGFVTVKDKNGNIYSVSIDDERYVSGELVYVWKGRQHEKEYFEKIKKTFKEIKHQQGEKNSRYGTVWVTKNGVNKSINKNELEFYINDGWVKGRKLNLATDKQSKIDKEYVLKLRSEGWIWKNIAKEIGVSEQTFHIWKKRNNL